MRSNNDEYVYNVNTLKIPVYRSFWRVPCPNKSITRRSTFLNLFPSNFISFGLYDLFLGGFSITPLDRSFGFFFSTAAFVDDKVCTRARPLLVGAVAARLVLIYYWVIQQKRTMEDTHYHHCRRRQAKHAPSCPPSCFCRLKMKSSTQNIQPIDTPPTPTIIKIYMHRYYVKKLRLYGNYYALYLHPLRQRHVALPDIFCYDWFGEDSIGGTWFMLVVFLLVSDQDFS